MTIATFALEDLKRILLEGAGADEGVDLDADILDTRLDDLGYESLALLETGSRIEREYGISLDESALIDAPTPRVLIDLVNARLSIRPSLSTRSDVNSVPESRAPSDTRRPARSPNPSMAEPAMTTRCRWLS